MHKYYTKRAIDNRPYKLIWSFVNRLFIHAFVVTTTRKQIYDFLMMHNHHGVDANVVSLFVNRSKEVYEWVYEHGTRVSKCVITPIGELYT